MSPKIYILLVLLGLLSPTSLLAQIVAVQQTPPDEINVENLPPVPVSSSSIVVNIPARKLTLYDHGEVTLEFPVAVGQTRYKTPTGKHELNKITWNPWWLPPPSPWAEGEKPAPPGPRNPLGPVKMELGNALRIHGTNNDKSVGRAASHGCMRMHNEDAKTLAWWLQSHYSDKTDEALKEQYQKNRGRSYYTTLNVSVPVEIKYELFSVINGKIVANPDIYWKEPNKKKKALQVLAGLGYDESRVDTVALDTLLKISKQETGSLALAEIVKGLSPVESGFPPQANEEGAAGMMGTQHAQGMTGQ